jgi:hypothetical protein
MATTPRRISTSRANLSAYNNRALASSLVRQPDSASEIRPDTGQPGRRAGSLAQREVPRIALIAVVMFGCDDFTFEVGIANIQATSVSAPGGTVHVQDFPNGRLCTIDYSFSDYDSARNIDGDLPISFLDDTGAVKYTGAVRPGACVSCDAPQCPRVEDVTFELEQFDGGASFTDADYGGFTCKGGGKGTSVIF